MGYFVTVLLIGLLACGVVFALCLPFALIQGLLGKKAADATKVKVGRPDSDDLRVFEAATKRAHYNAIVDYKYNHPDRR